jgi:hypothetical protein
LRWSMLGRLRSSVRRWSADTRFIPFVLFAGIGLFGGSSTAVFVTFDLMDGTLNLRRLAAVLELWPIVGFLWGSAMWLFLRSMKWLAQRSHGK